MPSRRDERIVYEMFARMIISEFVPDVMQKYPDLSEQEATAIALKAWEIPERFWPIKKGRNNGTESGTK